MNTIATRPLGANDEALPDDILVGALSISKFLYGEEDGSRETNLRRVYNALAKREIPTFRLGGKIHARKSAIRQRIIQQETAAMECVPDRHHHEHTAGTCSHAATTRPKHRGGLRHASGPP
jgi:hypothetical protein